MKAAGKMVMESNSKNPPAEYMIGSEVMVRRFSSKCLKRAGTQSASKTSRIVKGTITEINKKCRTYRILCKLESGHIEDILCKLESGHIEDILCNLKVVT